MRWRHVGWLTRLVLAGGAALVLTACPEEAADIVEVKGTSLDFAVAAIPAVSFPDGTSSRDRLLVQFDPNLVPDAFGRASWSGTPPELPGLFGPDTWAYFEPATRDQDPRKPLLTATGTASTSANGLLVATPASEGFGHYFFIVSGVLEGLPPNTTYTLAMARYGLQVNAELDQEAILLGQPITEPDSLVLLNPNPLGDAAVNLGVCGAPTNRGDTIFAEVSANPFIIGQGVIDATGCADPGIVLRYDTQGGTPVFFAGTDAPPTAAQEDSAMFGRNDDVAYGFPRYNYVVMFEGVGVSGPQVARWQVAQDMDLAGQPLQNGQMPFPTQAFTQQELADAPGSLGSRPDSITVELLNLEALDGGGVWQLWLLNRDEDPITTAPGVGTYERVAILRELDPITGEVISETDSVLETITGTSTFTGQLTIDLGGDRGEQEVKHRFTLSDAISAATVGFFTDAIVTPEAGPGAMMPSAARAVWIHYTDQNGTPSDFLDDQPGPGTALFGTFDPASPRIFSAGDFSQSSGIGGVLANEVSVEIRNLPRPPIGFYYEGWLVGPNGNRVSLGPVTSLPPDTVSLFDADVDLGLPGVTETGIRFAVTRAVLAPDAIVSPDLTVNLTNFFLTLEPKLGGPGKNVADLESGLLPTATIIERMNQ